MTGLLSRRRVPLGGRREPMLSREHVLLLAAFLGCIGAQLMMLEQGWRDALSPPWLGSTLLQLAIVVRGFYTEKPGQ